MTNEIDDEQTQQIEPVEWPHRYELEGRPVLEWENGSIQNAANGHWIRPPRITPIMQDPAGMVRRRYELGRQRALEGLDRGADVPVDMRGVGKGWELLIEHATRTFLKSGNTRGLGELLGKLGAATGFLDSRAEQEAGSVSIQQNNAYVSLNPDQASLVLDMLRQILAVKDGLESQRKTWPPGVHMALPYALEEDKTEGEETE